MNEAIVRIAGQGFRTGISSSRREHYDLLVRLFELVDGGAADNMLARRCVQENVRHGMNIDELALLGMDRLNTVLNRTSAAGEHCR